MIDVTAVLDNMKSRRAVRDFNGKPVSDDDLFTIVQAGRFASSGGNLRPHRFFVTRDQQKIGQIKAFSPGMLAKPPAIVAILIDHDQVAEQWVSIDESRIIYVDVGTAAQNIMNGAHAIGLGSCPVTSYSKSGIREVLGLPDSMSVEMLIMVGHFDRKERVVNPDAPKPVTTKELTSWETYGNHQPD
jgi:nitroreductase